MWCRLNNWQIRDLVLYQLNEKWNFKAIGGYQPSIEPSCIDAALEQVECCFSAVRSPYFWKDGAPAFKVEHSVQYAVFLYFLSHRVYAEGDSETAEYLYYLNKVMNGVEWYCAVELPPHFCAEHPLGSVLGKAKYGDYFFVYQGCTVGGNRKDGKLYYPVIGEHVTMYSDSKILGNCHVGDHVVLAANTYIINMDIPDYSMVFGQSPHVIVKQGMQDRIRQIEQDIWRTGC